MKSGANSKTLFKWPETNRGLYFILCLSIALKVLIALLTEVVKPDGLYYISVAQQFAAGNFTRGLSLYPMPSYPLLISLIHFFIPDWVLAAKIISVSVSVLVLVPLYLITCDLFNRRAAFWGSLAFAIAPFPNEYTAELVRGPLFLFFFAWGAYFANRAICSTRLLSFLLASLCCWLAVLYRIEGIIFFPVYSILLIYLALQKRNDRMYFLKGLAIWIGFPLCILGFLMVVSGVQPASFNRFTDVRQTTYDFFHLKFLDNYNGIQEQLKSLQLSSPHPGKRLNFFELARHFMPFIYLFGVLYALGKVLFLPLVLPLFLGLKRSIRRTGIPILVLTVSLILIVYYTLLEKNFIQSRYLFAPAFLLFPWIGAGIEQILAFMRRSSSSQLLSTTIITLFFVLPLSECVRHIQKQDNIVKVTGQWLADKTEFHKAKMITNDARVFFYAGRDYISGRAAVPAMTRFVRQNDYTRMERLARNRKIDLIVLKIPSTKDNFVPVFRYYKKIKELFGKKDIAFIYCSTKFHNALYGR